MVIQKVKLTGFCATCGLSAIEKMKREYEKRDVFVVMCLMSQVSYMRQNCRLSLHVHWIRSNIYYSGLPFIIIITFKVSQTKSQIWTGEPLQRNGYENEQAEQQQQKNEERGRENIVKADWKQRWRPQRQDKRITLKGNNEKNKMKTNSCVSAFIHVVVLLQSTVDT